MRMIYVYTLLLPCLVFLYDCRSSDDVGSTLNVSSGLASADVASANTSLFDLSSLDSLEVVECVLSNGELSTCYAMTVSGFPANRSELGAYGPENIDSSADNTGSWFDNEVFDDLTGNFSASLDVFYMDHNCLLFDQETAEVSITDTQESCEAAVRSDVAVAYTNFCIQCDINYYNEVKGDGISSTYLIPVTPLLRPSAADIGQHNIGVSFHGVHFTAAAPTEAI